MFKPKPATKRLMADVVIGAGLGGRPVVTTRSIILKEHAMNVDRAVLAFAGFVVLLGLALGHWVSPYWYLLTAFAGLNMIQASFSGFCPAATVFRKLGLRSGNAFQ